MFDRANALHTLIRQRHPTPSCGEDTSTAERTLDPARNVRAELDPRPGIRERPRPKGDIADPIFPRCTTQQQSPWWYELVLVSGAHPYAAIDASAGPSMTMLQNFGIDESGGSTSVQWSGPLNE